jgi:hypothetical protein
MRKIKEVLRLRFDLGLTQDQIARSCNIANPLFIGIWSELRRRASVGQYRLAAMSGNWRNCCFRLRPGGSRGRYARYRTWRRSMNSCKPTNTSRCSCCGRSTARTSLAAIATAGFASCTRAGADNRTSFCGKSIELAKRCLWTGQAPPFRFLTVIQATAERRVCLWRCWAQAVIRSPTPHRLRRCRTGLTAMYELSISSREPEARDSGQYPDG